MLGWLLELVRLLLSDIGTGTEGDLSGRECKRHEKNENKKFYGAWECLGWATRGAFSNSNCALIYLCVSNSDK
jgi:hypothetical protein